jgi:hypothetical protein
MMRKACGAAFSLLFLLPAAGAPRNDAAPVLQNNVDLAVRKGVQTLKVPPGGTGRYGHDPGMLVLLTLIHAGVPNSNPRLQEFLKRALESDLKSMYAIALTAMALEELDQATYHGRIRQCAQFLKKVDAWWRGAKKSDDPAELLQLDPPPALLRRRTDSTRPVLVVKTAPAGWGYYKARGDAIGSMTAGAVDALCILDYLQEKDWRQDEEVLGGLHWLSKHFSISENPGVGYKNFHYYLYGLERAGLLRWRQDTWQQHETDGARWAISDSRRVPAPEIGAVGTIGGRSGSTGAPSGEGRSTGDVQG